MKDAKPLSKSSGYRRRLTTIVIADICGYSTLSEQNEAAAIRLADTLHIVFERVTQRHNGRVFKRIADGYLAEFPSAHSGMQAALEYCKNVSERNNLSPNSINAAVRVGIHVGDVVDRDDGDILGHGVNIAARLQEQARPGTILASSNIMNLLGPEFKHRGEKRSNLSLKNISENMTAFQIDPKETKGLHYHLIPEIFKTPKFLYALLFVVMVSGFLAIQNKAYSSLIHKKIDVILQQSFSKTNNGTLSNISEAYIRSVLESLHNSSIPSHQTSFALLEAGNIEQAILQLELSLKDIEFNSKYYIDTLHQIATLSYTHDSAKAVGYYETILEMRPDDEAAMFLLIKAYHIRLEKQKAYKLSEKVLSLGIGSPFQKARLQIDMAFNHILNLDFKAAIKKLENAESDVIAVHNQRLLNEWRIVYGYSLARDGDLDRGESLLLISARELKKLGTDTNLPRAYNALGMISEARAENSKNDQRAYLEDALKYYQKQYNSGLEIDKKRELVEALYAMGEVYLKLGQNEASRQKFIESLKTARSNNYTNSEVRSRIGLAQIANINQDKEAVCQQVNNIVDIYKTRETVPMNEKMLNTLENFACGFDRNDLQ